MKKFTELSLKELAHTYGETGLEVSRIVICGVPMPHGGKVRYSMKDRCYLRQLPEVVDFPLYFYSDVPANIKWRVEVGDTLWPYSGNPIKVISEVVAR